MPGRDAVTLLCHQGDSLPGGGPAQGAQKRRAGSGLGIPGNAESWRECTSRFTKTVKPKAG